MGSRPEADFARGPSELDERCRWDDDLLEDDVIRKVRLRRRTEDGLENLFDVFPATPTTTCAGDRDAISEERVPRLMARPTQCSRRVDPVSPFLPRIAR